MSRPHCPKCHYPLTACLCSNIEPMSVSTELIVLQDPSEVTHAKNSVRLMALVIPETQIYVGETPDDFKSLRHYLEGCKKPIYLVYPSDISSDVAGTQFDKKVVLLFLDGTWRKAYKLLQLNPWLQNYPALHLDLESASNYKIRKASRADSLSTLEAAAMMLRSIEPELKVTPLTNALEAMVQQRIQSMPVDVRKRYE
ncbi:DTW domain-containing protein [Shewanella sp. D64]|uniref:tRNA-uridine aminocarboxypropyltransferase n=1 Tax=unclassified Shewanella TaxID=196818 RepID=UPI0022BA6812|nr:MULTISPECIES: tRNA-uridine aminocarboxypropyltransferase [unclassified Shewanella]MEC4728644.1 DTW domain-containing protein [Shewanella sp. D64]MEC4740593.1 DTW domain-containing protein [Shewanella sp. E94]WBJ95099.1 DTW domain-containing protein [Shewanella sp. MTB7]